MPYAACFLAAFALFIVSASPTVSFEDTGELITAAACLGVTHPPGYPWLTKLGALFLRLPVGDPAFRLNVMSATFGAMAVTTVFAIVALIQRTARSRPESPDTGSITFLHRWTGPGIAALALATSKTLWWQSGIAEKYTLSLALMMLTLLVLTHAWTFRRPATLTLAAFALGLSLSHHLHGLYLVPIAAIVAWRLIAADEGGRCRRVIVLATFAGLPMLAKATVIPIRAAFDPILNWGVPDRFASLIYYLSARQYRSIMMAGDGPGDIIGRVFEQITTLPLIEFGPALAMAVPGLVAVRGAGLLPGVAVIFAANVFLAGSYDTPEIERYYLLSYAVLATMMGLGASRILAIRRPSARMTAVAPIAAIAAVAAIAAIAAIAIPIWHNGHTSPRTRHYFAYDFAVNQLAPLPPAALLICEGDDQGFPLLYLNTVLRFRDDVYVVPMPDACSRVSYNRLMRKHRDLVLPPFVADPGQHLPRIIAANAPFRSTFYTPGCSGAGSERHLVPRGLTFAAFADRAVAAAHLRELPHFPALRLRGAIRAHEYGDPVTMRALENYGFSIGFHGIRTIESGNGEIGEAIVVSALRLPMSDAARASALTSLAMQMATTGRYRASERLFREAIALDSGFSPALLGLGKLLLSQGNLQAARRLLRRAADTPETLSPRLRRNLAAIQRRLQ